MQKIKTTVPSNQFTNSHLLSKIKSNQFTTYWWNIFYIYVIYIFLAREPKVYLHVFGTMPTCLIWEVLRMRMRGFNNIFMFYWCSNFPSICFWMERLKCLWKIFHLCSRLVKELLHHYHHHYWCYDYHTFMVFISLQFNFMMVPMLFGRLRSIKNTDRR